VSASLGAALGTATLRVLLVEDEEGDAALVRAALRGGAQRFDLRRATSLREATEQLAQEPVDVVLLDLGLPDSLGMEAVQEALAQARGAAIVVLTGLDDDATAERVLESGAQDYLVKGRVDSWSLPRAIRYAIERQHILTDLRRLIAEKDATHVALSESEARYRSIATAAADALVVADAVGQVVDWNPAAVRLFGYPEATALTLSLCDLVPSQHAEELAAILHRGAVVPESHAAVPRHTELPVERADGTTAPTEWAVSTWQIDGAQFTSAVVRDISERKLAEEQLRRLALHDSLTGLPNRALLLDRLQEALHRAERSGEAVGVLFLDLDRFKTINDTMGHQAGDELLVAVADRISSVLRPADTAARLGGDEFVMVCEGVATEERVLELAQRIRTAVCQAYTCAAGVIRVEASVGVCVSEPGDAPETLLGRSDTALYRAKERGRNRCEVLRSDEHGGSLSRSEIANGLRDAIDAGHLRLHYQPIHELETGRVAGAESLLRWQHPEHGLLAPGSFLQVAEETGVIVDVGRWVLHEACREAASWRAHDGARPVVWVNLSGRQAAGHSIAELVEGALTATGLAPDRLYLELTESVLFQASDSTISDLRHLVDRGVELGIDDFGTGYASMSYLANLPVTFLKVDRSFVDGAPHRSQDAAIVDAVVGLGRALDLTVIAEGIETADQLDWVGAAGCDLAQGYYLGRPAPPAALPFSPASVVTVARSAPQARWASSSHDGEVRSA
jgi:diguanylate cyclase (GGDEF)-like protein/PAS domain S-box-containing protein